MGVYENKNEKSTPSQPVSAIGFEGFEKRLEITFSNPPVFTDPSGLGLRALTRDQLDEILKPAACTIVAHLSNSEFDSYVLSESSLFVYPLRIILKTCGTTKLLLSIDPILRLADSVGLTVSRVVYSRGTLNFPGAQLAPHRSFSEEVSYLNGYFGHFIYGPSAYVLGDPTAQDRSWHVYSASKDAEVDDGTATITLEMCMTGLKREKAAVFYKKEGHTAKEMTKMSRIDYIIPSHVICDVDFDPCGYSMNGVDDGAHSTVHVTPEDGFSYASYEVMGFNPNSVRFGPLVQRVLRCFEPKEFTIAVTCFDNGDSGEWVSVQDGFDVDGFTCLSGVKQKLSGGGFVVYKTYVADQSTRDVHLSQPILSLSCWKEAAIVEAEVKDDGIAEVTSSCGGFLGCNAFVSPVNQAY
ncbi:S-adenosylmethionine decarboxylase proenzyme-like [Silene latifolia]|uniref:S-adenosylmethionine decarboxylase proenzyme-like n=1 Tax=Silene latifolia TaxID=37657 RepID=UPI003D7871F2